MLEEETTRSTFSILIFVLGLNQIMLRHHQGLVLNHREAEDEEENVPGLHGASVCLLLADDHVLLNYDFKLS